MAIIKYGNPITGEFKDIKFKVSDTLPVGTKVDYDGTDVPNGWEQVEDPSAYSLEEQIIGMCLKKPLYRKSFLINNSSQINENVIGRIPNIDLIVNLYGTMAIAGYITPLNSVWNDANKDLSVLIQVQSSNGDVIINQKSTPAKYPIFITIEYTKTTDSATKTINDEPTSEEATI